MTPSSPASFVARCPLGWAILALLCAAPTLHASGFSVLVSPPRFELAAAPGKVQREVVAITNASSQSTRLTVRTADWTLDPGGSPVFSDTLAPGSCRPWVALERRDIAIAPGTAHRFRFEIAPPAGTPPQECRFALLIEGEPEALATGGPVLPVSGRIGLIVYAEVGEVAPELEVVGGTVATQEGRLLPQIQVRNTGTAHGRLEGFLDGKDAAGTAFSFTPSSLPILPGETRTLALTPDDEKATPVYPLTLKGRLDWGKQHTDFERRFGP